MSLPDISENDETPEGCSACGSMRRTFVPADHGDTYNPPEAAHYMCCECGCEDFDGDAQADFNDGQADHKHELMREMRLAEAD